MSESAGPARRGPKPLPAVEHEHRWQSTGTTEVIGGQPMLIDVCGRRGCAIRRAVRVGSLAASGEDQAESSG